MLYKAHEAVLIIKIAEINICVSECGVGDKISYDALGFEKEWPVSAIAG